ncbi:MAG: hypothetical protein HYV07_25600 [Deltaproteobacteria bacterium]|nr:hypothetical protein [Deltaproteobacteria bacterium]
MDSSNEVQNFRETLTPLQRELITGFFESEDQLWLTGGAALAGFHLGRRETHDLDFFGPAGTDLEDAARRIGSVARLLRA